jgi:hypothetical protein
MNWKIITTQTMVNKMTYKIEDGKYFIFNFKGEKVVYTSDPAFASMLIKRFKLEKKDD